METALAQIICIALILGGLVLYFSSRICSIANFPTARPGRLRNFSYELLIALLTGIGLLSSALILLEE